MKLSLQKILFPEDERLEAHHGLFYRGPRLSYSKSMQGLLVPFGFTVDFASYLNGFPLLKWKLYSNLKGVSLKLRLKGKCRVNAVGYSLNPTMPSRHELLSEECDFKDFKELSFDFPPEINEQMLCFEILSYGEVIFSGGEFYGEFDENDIKNVTLCLATTTCRKEEFIKKNVKLIKDELLCDSSQMRDNFYVHVVDNGRTLSKEEIEGFHVTLHPNKNTGGSGGFARGMIEAMHQTPEATHVLLMDDDVLILPESIRRTYILLTVLKDEWKDAFISGAMLEFGAMNIQHEDIGTIDPNGNFVPAKRFNDQAWLGNVLNINNEIPYRKNMYAAWWFCCIPVTQIKKNGLPLPVFIRCDDAEYGLRCSPRFITMSGLCVWHMGFITKYNAAIDLYQQLRNLFIAQATTRVISEVNLIERFRRHFYRNLLEFYYDAAELILLSLEDFMKGPEFIEQDNGEKLLKEHYAFNEKLKPLSEFNVEVQLDHVYDNFPISRFKRLLYLATVNFQRFWPKFMLNKRFPAVVSFDWPHQMCLQFRHNEILAVNPFDQTANLRLQDRKRFRKIMKRYRHDMRLYKKNRKRLEAEYEAKRDWLTSEQFWRQYLEISGAN